MRAFSISRIEEELTHLKSKYSSTTLVIEDDMFLWDVEWAKSILRIAQKLDLVTFFPNALALYALDWDMLEELYKTGVRQLTLAVESGSARVLRELMRKPLKLSITNRVVNDCRKLGIYTDCNIIIGMPGETIEDIQDTRKFLLGLGANWYRINVATPLAGSEMYLKAAEMGYVKGDIRRAGYKSCVIETPYLSPQQVEQQAYALNLELNFLHNADMGLGNFMRAKDTFLNVVKLRGDHALAHLMLSICLFKLGEIQDFHIMREKSASLVSGSAFWTEFYNSNALPSAADKFYEVQLVGVVA